MDNIQNKKEWMQSPLKPTMKLRGDMLLVKFGEWASANKAKYTQHVVVNVGEEVSNIYPGDMVVLSIKPVIQFDDHHFLVREGDIVAHEAVGREMTVVINPEETKRFAKNFMKHMKTPSETIDEVLSQIDSEAIDEVLSQIDSEAIDLMNRTTLAALDAKMRSHGKGDEQKRDSEPSEELAEGISFPEALYWIMSEWGEKMRLPKWSEDVYISIQCPDEQSEMTAPYLYVTSRFGKVPWIPTQIEMFSKEWIVE